MGFISKSVIATRTFGDLWDSSAHTSTNARVPLCFTELNVVSMFEWGSETLISNSNGRVTFRDIGRLQNSRKFSTDSKRTIVFFMFISWSPEMYLKYWAKSSPRGPASKFKIWSSNCRQSMHSSKPVNDTRSSLSNNSKICKELRALSQTSFWQSKSPRSHSAAAYKSKVNLRVVSRL